MNSGITPSEASATLPASRNGSVPWVTLNDLLWLLYLYPIRVLARFLPRSFLYAIGQLSNPIVQFHARGRKAKAAPWIARACGATPVQAQRIASQSLTNGIFRTLDELLLLRPSPENMLRCDGMDGLENLDHAIARGKGVILLVGHFCANRIAIRYLASRGYPALAVHNQSPTNRAGGRLGKQFLQPLSVQLQERAYADQVYIQDTDCTLRIVRRLRAGGLAVVQVDGRGGTKVVEHRFLGRPWRVPSGIYEIARLSDCAVVPMLCLGRSSGFRIRFDPLLTLDPAPSREAFVSANLPRFLTAVENQIVENPEHWRLWNHF